MHLSNSVKVVLLSVFFLSGCASIVTGTDQQLTFNSEPEGATVIVAGQVVGKTPLKVSVDKGKNQSVVFEKDGYKTYTAQLTTTMNSWFFGNILIGGLLGSTTDGISGAIHEFSPDQYFVTLVPETPFGVTDSNSRKAKEFIISNASMIREELAAGEGDSLEALLKLINIELNDKESTIAALSTLAEETDNDLEFANAIVEMYELE